MNEYAIFVERVRENRRNGLELAEAMEKAVKDCIRDNVLREFLKIYGSDVVNMLSMEFNMDDALKVRELDVNEEIAENLLKSGMSQEIIVKNTGLSIERVKKIAQKIKSEQIKS